MVKNKRKREVNNLIIQRKNAEISIDNLPVALGELIPPMTYFKLNKRCASNCRGWLIKVVCPFCGYEHIHGGCEDPADLIPSRQAHCGGGRYLLSIMVPHE